MIAASFSEPSLKPDNNNITEKTLKAHILWKTIPSRADTILLSSDTNVSNYP